MKRIRTLMLLIIAVCMAAAAVLPAGAEGETPFPAQAQIERIVVSFAAMGERDEASLAALADMDPELGAKWTRIMDLWETPVPVLDALPDGLPQDDSLCLVALGFQLNPDGTMREELVERLKVMLAAAEKYPQAFLVCTGGGTAPEDPSATEAGRMAEWLTARGVDPARLIVEDRSVTTAQNAIYTFDLLEERCPQVKQLAIISSDYHIATGTLLFGAEAILRDSDAAVVSNAAWHAPSGTLSAMFQAGALIELSGDVETAFDIYYETYDIHELPPLHAEEEDEAPETDPDAGNDVIDGGWGAAADPTVTEELRALFDKGMAGLTGVGYEPVAYLGSKIVAGYVHAILCQATVVYPGASPRWVIVYLFEDLEGNVTVTDIADLAWW